MREMAHSVCQKKKESEKISIVSFFLTTTLALFGMGFCGTVSHWGVGRHHNFVVIAPMIMKFGTGIKLDVFYTTVAKGL